MPEIPSESLHEAIRRALNAGDFDTVRQLSGALGQAIIREARAAAPGGRQAVINKGLSRLREHLSLARVLRAHVANQLQANTTLSLYQQAGGHRHSWHFDA
jgi:hypothetical protein